MLFYYGRSKLFFYCGRSKLLGSVSSEASWEFCGAISGIASRCSFSTSSLCHTFGGEGEGASERGRGELEGRLSGRLSGRLWDVLVGVLAGTLRLSGSAVKSFASTKAFRSPVTCDL